VMTPRSSCPGAESTPLRGANLRLFTNHHSNSNLKPDLPDGMAVSLATAPCPIPISPLGSFLESTGR